jgi:hypothetical protein
MKNSDGRIRLLYSAHNCIHIKKCKSARNARNAASGDIKFLTARVKFGYKNLPPLKDKLIIVTYNNPHAAVYAEKISLPKYQWRARANGA